MSTSAPHKTNTNIHPDSKNFWDITSCTKPRNHTDKLIDSRKIEQENKSMCFMIQKKESELTHKGIYVLHDWKKERDLPGDRRFEVEIGEHRWAWEEKSE